MAPARLRAPLVKLTNKRQIDRSRLWGGSTVIPYLYFDFCALGDQDQESRIFNFLRQNVISMKKIAKMLANNFKFEPDISVYFFK